MATKFINDLIEELGESQTVTIQQLVKIGLFGTPQSARQALRSGRLPHIKISPRRCLIAREHLIQFIKENFHGKLEYSENCLGECISNDSKP